MPPGGASPSPFAFGHCRTRSAAALVIYRTPSLSPTSDRSRSHGEGGRDNERGERRDRGASRLGEPRVHLPHLPQRPPPRRLPRPVRGHDKEQAGNPEREARHTGAQA